MKKIIILCLLIGILSPALVCGTPITPIRAKFSIDHASPSIDGNNITPDDVLIPSPDVLIPGPAVHTQGISLDLSDDFFSGFFDNLNALSYGKDPIQAPLYFFVDRDAVGLPGSGGSGVGPSQLIKINNKYVYICP